ncbi:MAG: MnmC family methyltransferase [Candidatus Woesearchaeota archaeon]|nr:MnmC family methyltransferase [Candidatus Woesearchaeota archaeon]
MELNKIVTGDGSVTFYNTQYGEAYHSMSGAEEEAVKKYAEVCREKLEKNVRVLDVCFGLGYNTAAALDVAEGTMEIVGLENDEQILQTIPTLTPKFARYPLVQACVQKKGFSITEKNISLKIILGDARKTITRLVPLSFDVVFFDPFSPKKCPELWTEEFFRAVAGVMKKGAMLTTYSCATEVRQNMKKAGFVIKDGPSVGRKAPSTIAIKA